MFLMFNPVTALHQKSLPVFYAEAEAYNLFYAPGYLAIVPSNLTGLFVDDLLKPEPTIPEATAVRRWANQAVQTWQKRRTEPFAPVCLTLYLHNQCNLHCTYCYAAASPHPSPRLTLQAVHAAAHLVAQNCVQQNRPLTLVCHGGGEPTLDLPYLMQVVNEVETVAAAFNLPLFRYLATNGVMPTATAQTIARRFDLIGLSCDGPAAVQATQRPLWGGQSSTSQVENTAKTIHEQGTPLHVRVTLTADSLSRQVEIVHYLCQKIKPAEIHVEPVYAGGRADSTLPLAQANLFVEQFLQAQTVAHEYGVPWLTSGSRPQEIHGPYCQILRQVLNLIPGDVATTCFKTSRASEAREAGVQIGQQQADSSFGLDQSQVEWLRSVLAPVPERCRDCFNQYHCGRDCPDLCPLDSQPTPSSTFRCQVQKQLTQTHLLTLAHRAWLQSDRRSLMGLELMAA
jgi:uncharacterized protein